MHQKGVSKVEDAKGAVMDVAELGRLVSTGLDTEFRDEWGCTLLFHAIMEANLPSIDLLIRAGADVNALAGEPGCTILASTPLRLAKQCGLLLGRAEYLPIILILQAAGALDADPL